MNINRIRTGWYVLGCEHGRDCSEALETRGHTHPLGQVLLQQYLWRSSWWQTPDEKQPDDKHVNDKHDEERHDDEIHGYKLYDEKSHQDINRRFVSDNDKEWFDAELMQNVKKELGADYEDCLLYTSDAADE